MLRLYTPCDDGVCPYGAEYGNTCEYYCSEPEPDFEPEDDGEYPDEYDDPDDLLQNMPCDNSGICAGSSCSQYFKCNS